MRRKTNLWLLLIILVSSGALLIKPSKKGQLSTIPSITQDQLDSSKVKEPTTAPSSMLAEFHIGKGGRPLVVDGTINGQPIRVLVDTGAGRTVFDETFRSALGITNGQDKLQTSKDILETDTYNWPNFKIGQLETRSESSVFCSNCRGLSTAAGERIDAVLGMDVLKQYVVQVDFDNGILRLFSEVPSAAYKLGEATPLTLVRNSRPTVHGICGQIDADFILDTGSHSTCLERELFDSLVEKGSLITGTSRGVQTPSGKIIAKTGLLNKLSVGRFAHGDLVCERDVFNLLGLRYLSRYNLVLDFPSGIAHFGPNRSYSKSDLRGFSGIQPVRTTNGYTVAAVATNGPAELAGLRAGDEITTIDGKPAVELDMFGIGEVFGAQPGRHVALAVNRQGEERVFEVVVRDRFAITK